jgi:peptidoglycan/xylan/chitin deacetylase (PgdA/CDA1 family)
MVDKLAGTSAVLNILKRLGVKATFFINSHNMTDESVLGPAIRHRL